jgi:hypothetical protein
VSRDDVRRYIEFDMPAMGIVENKASELVCFTDGCDERITVDPETLVAEDTDACCVEADVAGSNTRVNVQLFCSIECRNETYSVDKDTDTTDIAEL